MVPNETSALLKNFRDQQYSNDYNQNNNNIVVDGYHAVDENNHIVYVNKDASEYEPIFCLNEYTSSLTLDELLPYKLDPWWQKLRRTLLFTFWLTLILTFLTACVLSYLQSDHTSCRILEKQMSTASIGMSTSSVNSVLVATTTLPTTIAKAFSAELLGGK